MKRLAFLFLIGSSFFGYGQTKKVLNYGKSKSFYMGINLSPDACNRNYKNIGGTAIGDSIEVVIDNITTYKFGYTISANIEYVLLNHFAIETGIQYSNKGYQTKETDLNFGNYIDPRYGFTYQTNGNMADVESAKIIWNYHYIGIPLKVNYETGKRKLVFTAGGGIVFEYLIKTTNTTVTKDFNGDKDRFTRDYNPVAFNKINLSPTLSAGMKYKWNEKMFLKIEPTVRYGILKLTDTDMTQYLWSVGLNVGFYCSL